MVSSAELSISREGNCRTRSPIVEKLTQAATSRCVGRVACNAARAFARPSRPVLRVCSSSTHWFFDRGESSISSRLGWYCERSPSALLLVVAFAGFFMVITMTKGSDKKIIPGIHQKLVLNVDRSLWQCYRHRKYRLVMQMEKNNHNNNHESGAPNGFRENSADVHSKFR